MNAKQATEVLEDEQSYILLCIELAYLDGRISVHEQKLKAVQS